MNPRSALILPVFLGLAHCPLEVPKQAVYVSDACEVLEPYPKALATTPEHRRWGYGYNRRLDALCPPPATEKR